MSEKSIAPKSVAVVIYPWVSMLEVTGTYSVLNGLKTAKYEVYVTSEVEGPVPSDTPLRIVANKSFTALPNPNILVVMGGGFASLKSIASPALRDYVRSASGTADTVIGVGTGSLVLAACGLLDGVPAATHWAYSGLMTALGANYEQQRWIENGKIITTAGGTAGMDMGLMLVARLAGEQNARLLQLFAEYDPEPPFGGIQWEQVNQDGEPPFSESEMESLVQAYAQEPALLEAARVWAARTRAPQTSFQV